MTYRAKEHYRDAAVAEAYDDERFASRKGRFVDRRERSLIADAIRRSGVSRGAEILDVPIGTGRLTRSLAVEGYSVTGIDVSEQMLARAAERLSDLATTETPRLVQGDAEALPFPRCQFRPRHLAATPRPSATARPDARSARVPPRLSRSRDRRVLPATVHPGARSASAAAGDPLAPGQSRRDRRRASRCRATSRTSSVPAPGHLRDGRGPRETRLTRPTWGSRGQSNNDDAWASQLGRRADIEDDRHGQHLVVVGPTIGTVLVPVEVQAAGDEVLDAEPYGSRPTDDPGARTPTRIGISGAGSCGVNSSRTIAEPLRQIRLDPLEGDCSRVRQHPNANLLRPCWIRAG